MEAELFTPTQTNEAHAIRELLPRMQELTESTQIRVEGIIERTPGHAENLKGDPTRAWRIIFKPYSDADKPKAFFLTDWDDTLEPYSKRKNILADNYREILPKDNPELVEKFLRFVSNINKAARVLPVNGIHPERYSPFLEVMATSEAMKIIEQSEDTQFLDNPTEESARSFISSVVLPKLNGKVDIHPEEKKTYFREAQNQAAAIDFEKKPFGVDDQIWDCFLRAMTQANIPLGEMDNFDLDDDIRWIISTFGEPNFQLEKVLNGLVELKKAGKRTPDEVIVFTRGRKEPVITKLAGETGSIPLVYLDDSVGQLEKVMGIPNIIALRALRSGSKRSQSSTPRMIGEVYMDTGPAPLSKIVAMGISGKSFITE